MPELFAPLLFLHVLGAIVALGPAFAFPLIGGMAAREPEHGNFPIRITHVLDERVVVPAILSTAVTGAGLIWAGSIPVFAPAYRWLLLSIVIYAVALAVSLFVQRPATLRVIALTGGFPGPAGRPALATAGGPRMAAAPSPEIPAAIDRTRRNGMVLTVLSVAIVLLMVVKPSLGF